MTVEMDTMPMKTMMMMKKERLRETGSGIETSAAGYVTDLLRQSSQPSNLETTVSSIPQK
jgi:hypothetical protein